MPVYNSDIVNTARRIDGVPYIFGAEVRLSDPTPTAFDCSEAVQWILWQASGSIVAPDGAWTQANWCHQAGWLLSIEEALTVPGCLLFNLRDRGGRPIKIPTLAGRPYTSHVAITDGTGYVWEALNQRVGCGRHKATERKWTHAYTIPGVLYPPPPLPQPPTERQPMKFYVCPNGDIYCVGFTNGGLRKQHVTSEWAALVGTEEANLIKTDERTLAGIPDVA